MKQRNRIISGLSLHLQIIGRQRKKREELIRSMLMNC